MRREGIVAATERQCRWTATVRGELPAAPNHLAQDFRATAPNQRWVSDITFIRTSQGGLHLAIVLDLRLLDRHGLGASTSRPGHCLDNAVAESFFHTLKTDFLGQVQSEAVLHTMLPSLVSVGDSATCMKFRVTASNP